VTDFSSWPTFPSGLEGDWVDADVFFRIDLMTYREPDRGILELIDNENCRTRSAGWELTQQDMLSRMTGKQREVAQMRMDGYLQHEIAGAMGISQQAVSCRMQFAQGRVQNLVK